MVSKKAKCKYCNEEISTSEDKVIIIETTKTGKQKKISIHKNCEDNYKELMEYKRNELYWFDQVYEQLKDILGYNKEQIIPNSLITRIQDLRNGTVLRRGEGRVIKSKEGYKYEIILDCLLSIGDNIRWAMKNKTFKREANRINYIMAIIEENINDSYENYTIRERNKKNDSSIDIIEEEVRVIEVLEKNKSIIAPNKHSKGIAKFLDEDDF